MSSTPGEPRVVGAGRPPRSQQAERRASASDPAPISRATFLGHRRPSSGAFLPAEAWRVPAKACPEAGQNRRLAKPLLCVIIVFLHFVLPKGFNSWTQVLTDWAVSRVWLAARTPGCLADRPELAAPFVTEISAAIRHRQIPRWAGCLALVQAKATEPTFDRVGDPADAALRPEIGSAQLSFFSDWHVARSGEVEAPVFAPLSQKSQQTDYEGTRLQHEPSARQAAKDAARTFWQTRDPRVITDTYFADEPLHAPAARLARIHPPWWGAFHLRLQKAFRNGHPAEGHLLDALPEVRRQAGKRSKLTLEATVSLWWQDHQDRLGWYCKQEPHYRMIARRAAKKKAPQLIQWLDRIAPGYRLDQSVRVALHAELAARLRASDPQSVAIPSAATTLPWGEHGPN